MTDHGYILGVNESGRIIAVNSWLKEKSRTTSHWLIVGNSGGGKSFFGKKLVYNEWSRGTKIIGIDPENELFDLCNECEGNWIDCSRWNW